MHKILSKVLFSISTIFILVQCANPGSPTGGPKDETPPTILKSDPSNNTTNFNSNEIVIQFDELIRFKDLKKQLVISPPMKHEPIIKPTASATNKVSIEILDTLAENTTYTINFGNALQDNHEGNVYSNFRYILSTGDHIDSLFVKGKVSDAFSKKHEENIMVMLYSIDSSFTDSTIFLKQPTYVTSTIGSDTFNIQNTRPGKYLLIALEEKSRNLKFDPSQDKIAFYPDYITLPDSNKYKLSLFKQESDFAVKRPIHAGKGNILFQFEGKPKDIKVERLHPISNDSIIDLLYLSKHKDSANYWFSHRDADSIQFVIKSEQYSLNDTVVVTLKKQKKIKSKFEIENGKGLTTNNRLKITSNYPLNSFVKDSISILSTIDSTNVDYILKKDGNNKLILDFQPMYGHKYEVKIMPGALTNIFGINNDTLIYKAGVNKKSEYGEIIFSLKNVASYPIIVDLIDKEGSKIYKSIIAHEKMDFVFKDLNPGIYKIRVIYDTNNNGYWDSGNFLKKKQPELVKYFPDEINLKANWDIQQEWILKK